VVVLSVLNKVPSGAVLDLKLPSLNLQMPSVVLVWMLKSQKLSTEC